MAAEASFLHALSQSDLFDGFHRRQGLDGLLPGLLTVAGLAALWFTVCLMTLVMPPFQNPDEPAHFLRAEQISRGHPIGYRYSEFRSGGATEIGIRAAYGPFSPVFSNRENKFTSGMLAQAGMAHWSGELVEQHFPNTAVYPPFFYLPSAIGILIGKAAGLSIVDTLYLSRLLSGLCSMALGTAGTLLAGRAAPLLLAVLALPMGLSLMASVSQDGPMIGLAALAAAISVRMVQNGAPPFRHAVAVLTLALALIATARPPYAAFALLPLTLPGVAPAARRLSALTIFGLTAAWAGLAAVMAQVVMERSDVMPDAVLQVRLLLDDPYRIVSVAFATLSGRGFGYLNEFVGQLGWLDVGIPRWFHKLAWIVLAAGLLGGLSQAGRCPQNSRWSWIAVAIIALGGSAAGIFGIQYLTWTAPGDVMVDGVQGRYFLVPALLLATLPPAVAISGDRTTGLARLSWLVVTAFPLVTSPVMVWQVLSRYYLQS
ncbi:hypothetical protein GGE65_005134 [Skermanella aerolata]|uniref:DUF2142 domain-containing protein n=1 Tax=Skermanella aerolata TaxID=393310 RepID=UPI003D254F37